MPALPAGGGAYYDRQVVKQGAIAAIAMLCVSVLVAGQRDARVALDEADQLRRAGDTAAALEAYRYALEASQPATHERADALIRLSGLEADLGRYDDAVGHARDAVAVLQPLGDAAGMSEARNAQGKALLYAGKYGEAAVAFEDALKLSTAAGNDAARAEQLGNLANVQFFLGRYAQAAVYYADAIAIVDRHSTESWVPRRRRLLLANQATLYQRLGRDQQALALYKQLEQSAASLRPEEQGQLLTNVGVLYRRLGDPIKALDTYAAARALFARDRHVDGELGVLKNRGIVLALDLGRLDAAEQAFSEALAVATRVENRREILHARLYRGETILRAGDLARAREDFTASLALARDLGTPEEEWKALFGLARTQPGTTVAQDDLVQAVATIERIRESIRVPSLRSDFLNDKREVYDALLAARAHTAPAAEFFNLLERSHSRGWRERLKLSASADLQRIQDALPPRALLLDYWASRVGAAVVAIRRERAAVVPVRFDEGEIKAQIDGLAAGPSSDWEQRSAALSALLPSADWFDGIDHVVVVADGPTALVPFELLRVDGRALVQRVAVSYTPTAVTLLRPPPSGRLRAPWQLELVAFGDPIFGTATLDDDRRVRGRLSATSTEVHAVAAELAGRAALHVREDNRKALLLEASDAPILHVATHAMADARAMEQSHLVFSAVGGAESDADYLFLNEAYELPLQGVELAVLSACDTERGPFVRGEGVQSFSRAFLAAGARSTVTTLWRVADGPTAEFMTVFYHHLQQGLARDEALRRAKLAFAGSGTALADPHFWAAFVISGDALAPVPRAVPWMWLLAPPVGALGALALVAHRRRARRRVRSTAAAA